MPAGAVVGGVLGAAGGYFNSRSQKRTAANQQQAIQNAAAMMGAPNVMQRAQAYNPFLYNALMNPNTPTNNPFGQNLRNMAANPGYIDPALMNLPLTQATRGQQQGLLAAQSQLGRSGMEGGMGDAYALASQAALTGQRAGIMQNYSLWREQQRRADIDWLMNQFNNAVGMGQQGQGMQAGIYQQLPQYMQPISTTGNMITGALAGMGSMFGMGGMGGGGALGQQAGQGAAQGMANGMARGMGQGFQMPFQQQQAPQMQAALGNPYQQQQPWGANLFTQRR